MNLYNAPAIPPKSPEKPFKCVFRNGKWQCIASVPGLGELTGSGQSPREAYESIRRYAGSKGIAYNQNIVSFSEIKGE